MAIFSIKKITADNAGSCIMSIRLRSDGLSFSGYIPSVAKSFFFVNQDFDRSIPYLHSLKDFFFEHELLSYSYKRLNIMWVPSRYLLVPESAFQEKKRDELFTFAFSSPPSQCLYYPIKEEQAVLLYEMDDEIYEFCSRSFLYPRFLHPMYPLLSLWRRQSREYPVRQLFVFLRRKQMDLACFAQGKLLFVNSFEAGLPNDVIYHILYVWRQLGLDQQKDRLRIIGEAALSMEVTGILQNYLQYIEPLKLPVEAFLMGEAVVQASPDLIALSLCEL